MAYLNENKYVKNDRKQHFMETARYVFFHVFKAYTFKFLARVKVVAFPRDAKQ